MNPISLRRPAHAGHWLRIYKLYHAAFPRSERKPFSVILRQYRRGVFDVWCICRQGTFSGLAITMKKDNMVLIDYLAICPDCRSQGVGTAALQALRSTYPDKDLFLEIESVYEDVPDKLQRQRRKAFYLHSGLTPMEVMVMLFGVNMELLGFGCRISFAQYHDFYRSCMGPWAASHISSLPYPTTQIKEET